MAASWKKEIFRTAFQSSNRLMSTLMFGTLELQTFKHVDKKASVTPNLLLMFQVLLMFQTKGVHTHKTNDERVLRAAIASPWLALRCTKDAHAQVKGRRRTSSDYCTSLARTLVHERRAHTRPRMGAYFGRLLHLPGLHTGARRTRTHKAKDENVFRATIASPWLANPCK